MIPLVRKHPGRMFLIGFTLALAALLLLWSYSLQAADVNNSLTVSPNPVRPNQTVVLTGRNFESRERIGVWVTYPNFKVYPVAELRADRDGNFTLTYLPNFVGEPSGQYVYTAYGHATERQIFANLQVDAVQPVDPPASGFTGLTVSPNAATSFGTVTITGYGYEEGEEVSVWVTYPDFGVTEIDVIKANDDGNFSLTFTPENRGNGEYLFTGQGNESARTFYAEMQIGPVTVPNPPAQPVPPQEPVPTAAPAPTAVPVPTATPIPGDAAFTVSPATVSGPQDITLTGQGFFDDQTVSIWVTYPNARVESVADLDLDNGSFTFTYRPDFLDNPDAEAGRYTYTARGKTSRREFYAGLEYDPRLGAAPAPTTPPAEATPLPGGDGLDVPQLMATPNVARQNDTIVLEGSGFMPNEMVAIWITYPNFEVYTVAEVETNAAGDFSLPFVLDRLDATFTPTGKYTYTARGKTSGREVYADVQVEIGAAPAASEEVVITVEPGRDSQGSFFTIRGANFGASEMLALWLRYPDNTVAEQGRIQAGPDGSFEYVIYTDGSPTGRYAFTARGLSTDLVGIVEFEVTVSDLTVPTGSASLVVSPGSEPQRSIAIFEGTGFQPGETVTVWVTLPDNSTMTIGNAEVDASGAFVASLYLGEQDPVGQRTYTAYGNTSGRRAIAEFTLIPGGS